MAAMYYDFGRAKHWLYLRFEMVADGQASH